MKNSKKIAWIIVAVMGVIALVGVWFMPDVIAIQWNTSGVSNTAPKWMVFVFPALGVLCTALHQSQNSSEEKSKAAGFFFADIILFIAEIFTVCAALWF